MEVTGEDFNALEALKKERMSRERGTICVLHEDEDELKIALDLRDKGLLYRVREEVIVYQSHGSNNYIRYTLFKVQNDH